MFMNLRPSSEREDNKVRMPRCKIQSVLKLVAMWAVSIVIIYSVLLYMRTSESKNMPHMAKDHASRKPKVVEEAERFIKVGIKQHEQDALLNVKRTNQSLEKLQFFPKIDQAKILNAALVNQPELKNFLKERFNVSDTGGPAGPDKPLMFPKMKYRRLMTNVDPSFKTHEFKYIINVRDKCLAEVPFILIIVPSAWYNLEQRNLIRQTWGAITSYKGYVIRTLFVLAKGDSQTDDTGQQKDQKEIVKERQMFDDVIQGDFIDSYRNLSLKHLFAYHWVLANCYNAKYILKVDDDTLVNIFQTVHLLISDKSPLRGTTDMIYCSVYVNQGPRREKTDKWFVTKEEYPHDKYPSYCEGFAYITTSPVLLKLYNASLTTPLYWIDDVYVTGILAKKTDIKHRQFRKPYGYDVIRTHKNLQSYTKITKDVMFLVAQYSRNSQLWTNIWHIIVNRVWKGDFTVNSRYQKINLPQPHTAL